MLDTEHIKSTLLADLPDSPGCYIFKDIDNRIIYIGKARSLTKRISSYFQKKGLDAKTEQLIKHITSLDIIATDNEVEALILENNLVKKHTPKYNIKLKDAKQFAYIQLTQETFPRLVIARSKSGKGEFFGPFVTSAYRDYILGVLQKTFQLRTCKKMPKKPCLRYHIKLCHAPCTANISEEEYKERMDRARMILKGKTSELIRKMTAEMKRASEELNFEYAMELRNQAEAMRSLQEKQNMDRQKKYDEDIVNFLVHDDKVYLMLFNVYKGILENKQGHIIDYMEDFFQEFLVRFYSENPIPAELIVPVPVDEAVASYLREKRGKALRIKVPEKGEKKQLLELVRKNIILTYFGDRVKLKDLKRRLSLQELPEVIECFDISHLSGTAMVASMVQFRNARPDKSNYRRFKIKTLEGIDDFAAIAEVVNRRYARLIEEKTPLPDLVVIDGGLGQLNAALAALEHLSLKIPVISLAKQFEEVYVPGLERPLRMNKKTKALQLLQQIRDEAHRFAITYNRLLRKKELLK